ncbi:MAG TPA: hypothetical protein VFE82_19720 [Ramlibacter sp.]|jgi:hypothetical protein|uniref:hypothetical protein n=1 Tax=Ramlibacter sp. TaxID=1917967 RepID=UPI002D4D9BF2|nr:hypothetical protein [Ramlibacter sp.]HZY20710.1 hypothetical protein [Ramlibacter sp.]
MDYWLEELALMEQAALRIQAREEAAERLFDEALARAEQAGVKEHALRSEEFNAWMAARHDSDAAWGRWAMVMDAKPPA